MNFLIADFVPMGKKFSDKTTHEKPLIWLSKRCSDMDKGGFSHTPVLRFTISWPHILNTGHFCCGPTHLFLFSSNNVVIKAVVFVVVAFFNVFYWAWPFSVSFIFARPIVVLFWDWVNPIKLVSVVISLLKNTRFLQADFHNCWQTHRLCFRISQMANGDVIDEISQNMFGCYASWLESSQSAIRH